MDRIEAIRNAERESHTQAYSAYTLFAQGTWLAKPVKTVMDILPLFENTESVEVLDLGCGVGRNAIPIAQWFSYIPCKVACIDILPLAIEKLTENAVKYGVEEKIEGTVSEIEDYTVCENRYDLILAISALEHLESRAAFEKKLAEIKQGIRPCGVVCLIINSGVREADAETGEKLEPQFEVNLSTDVMLNLLESKFEGWETVKRTVNAQHYDIPRGKRTSHVTTNVVTFVARNLHGRI